MTEEARMDKVTRNADLSDSTQPPEITRQDDIIWSNKSTTEKRQDCNVQVNCIINMRKDFEDLSGIGTGVS